MYRPKNCLRCGGKPKMQIGGQECFDSRGNVIPCQNQQLQGSSSINWQNSQAQTPVNPALQYADPAYTTKIQEEGERTNYQIDPIKRRGKNWVIDNKKPFNPLQTGLAMKVGLNGLSWISGMVDRNRQNQYWQQQLSTLGQLTPANVEGEQPNPYNLYARFGGKLSMYRGKK